MIAEKFRLIYESDDFNELNSIRFQILERLGIGFKLEAFNPDAIPM